jgi:uncharacterized protein (DUF58 family)
VISDGHDERAARAELDEVLAEVRRIAVFTRRRAVSVVAGGYRSAFKGTGLEFESVREYAEGDDPRAVDWNVTARMGRPFVKTYSDERDRLVLFAIDVDRGMDGGLGAWSSRRAAASIVAMLALGAADHGDRVGAVHFGPGLLHHAAPRRGAGHALCVVRDTLVLRPVLGAHDDGASQRALKLLATSVRRRAILFVVTDGLRELDERGLARARRRHEVVVVRVVPAEVADAASGARVRLVDPASGRTFVTARGDSPAGREARERLQRTQIEFRERCERAGADLVDAHVPFEADPTALLAPLVELFRRRVAHTARGVHG